MDDIQSLSDLYTKRAYLKKQIKTEKAMGNDASVAKLIKALAKNTQEIKKIQNRKSAKKDDSSLLDSSGAGAGVGLSKRVPGKVPLGWKNESDPVTQSSKKVPDGPGESASSTPPENTLRYKMGRRTFKDFIGQQGSNGLSQKAVKNKDGGASADNPSSATKGHGSTSRRLLHNLSGIGKGFGDGKDAIGTIVGGVKGGLSTISELGETLAPLTGGASLAASAAANLSKKLIEASEFVFKFGDTLHKNNMQFSEFSPSMGTVQAMQEMRDALLKLERGERLAPSAEKLARSKNNFDKVSSRWTDSASIIMNYGWARVLDKLSFFLQIPSLYKQVYGKKEDGKKEDGKEGKKNDEGEAFFLNEFSNMANKARDHYNHGRPKRFD